PRDQLHARRRDTPSTRRSSALGHGHRAVRLVRVIAGRYGRAAGRHGRDELLREVCGPRIDLTGLQVDGALADQQRAVRVEDQLVTQVAWPVECDAHAALVELVGDGPER